MSAVVVRGVARRFGRRWALRGLSLDVSAGEVVALVGHNGSGKTTLLRVLATALRPTLGSGAVFGHDLVEEADDVRALVGLLGHAPGLYQDLTAAENLRFALRMREGHTDAATVGRALDAVGLLEESATRVRGFSAGMQRRLSLARILLSRPRLMLLDEPYASFDPEGVERVNALIAERRSAGAVTIVATHDPEKGAHLIDRTVRLDNGRIATVDAGVLGIAGGPREDGAMDDVSAEREWSA